VLKEALPRIGLEICEDAEDLMDSWGGVLSFKATRSVMRSGANRCTYVRAECGCEWSNRVDLQLLTGTCFQMDARC
jgi:hypothetical protein